MLSLSLSLPLRVDSSPPRRSPPSPPALAFRQESRRSLLAGDPGFANQTYNDGGYYYREGFASSSHPNSIRRSNMDFLATKWAKAFMLTSTVQAIICLAFEAYVFGEFQSHVIQGIDINDNKSQYQSIPTFFTLFIFGFLYDLVLVWDALRMKTTLPVLGICIAPVVFLVYTAVQIDQINVAITHLSQNGAVMPNEAGGADLWSTVRPFLIAIPCVIGATTLVMAYIAWKLYQEFAWDILKQIGADYRMKKRFLHYQVRSLSLSLFLPHSPSPADGVNRTDLHLPPQV